MKNNRFLRSAPGRTVPGRTDLQRTAHGQTAHGQKAHGQTVPGRERLGRTILRRMALILAAALVLLAGISYYISNKKVTSVRIMEGTAVETAMTVIDSGTPGKTVFVIGGIHGDEISGWKAGNALKKVRHLQSGTLIVLSPANAPGSRARNRDVEEYRDLNRSFPGDKDRDLTDKLAAAIYRAVKDASPDIVIDLHEAYREGANRDFLGNSLIFTDITGMEELIPELILETQSGQLCTEPFSYFGSAPRGSLNREVTRGLAVPVLTIEASREDELRERVDNHLALVHRIMRYYSLQ